MIKQQSTTKSHTSDSDTDGSVHTDGDIAELGCASPLLDVSTHTERDNGYQSTPEPECANSTHADQSRSPIALLRSWLGWILLLLVIGGAGTYLFTAGHGSAPMTLTERISYIEGIVRCPDVDSCGGTIPVSETNAPVAIEIKDTISADVKAGMSTSDIKRLLVERYGPGILLSPSTSGLGLLLWLLPAIAGICVITMFYVLFFRRSRTEPGVAASEASVDIAELAESAPAADIVDTSIDTVNTVNELDAGIDPEEASMDAATIGAVNERAGNGIRHFVSSFTGRHPKALPIGGTLCIVAAVGIGVASSLHARLQGEVATGGISISSGQEIQRRLVQASAAEDSGNDVTALKLYNDVLAVDPNQVQALSESGWITYETGVLTNNSRLMASGEARVKKAMEVSPSSFAPHLYLGTIYLHQGNSSNAAVQYNDFLKDNPPKDIRASAASFMKQALAKYPPSH